MNILPWTRTTTDGRPEQDEMPLLMDMKALYEVSHLGHVQLQVHFLCFGINEKNVKYVNVTFRNQLFLRSAIIFFQQSVPYSMKNENPFLLP